MGAGPGRTVPRNAPCPPGPGTGPWPPGGPGRPGSGGSAGSSSPPSVDLGWPQYLTMALLSGPGVRGLHCQAWHGSDLAPWPGVTICPHRISPYRQAGRALPLTPCGPPQTSVPHGRPSPNLGFSPDPSGGAVTPSRCPRLPTQGPPRPPHKAQTPAGPPLACVCAALSLRPRPPPRKLCRAASSCSCLRSKARSRPRVFAPVCLSFHRQRLSCSFWSPPGPSLLRGADSGGV